MQSALRIVLLLGAAYALACLVLFLLQRSLLYYPQPRRLGTDATVMKLAVADAELLVSTRPATGPEAVIYFGGNGEDVSGSVPDLAAAFPAHALYALHYRGYGGSSGKPSQDALFADALALFDKVHASHPHVTVVGRSLGSGVAVHLASVRPAERLVLVTPYDSIAGIAAARFPYFPVRFLLRDRYESFRYAPQIKVPTTIITAERDEVIPRASTSLLRTRFAPGIAHEVVIAARGHNTLQEDPLYTQALSGRR
ncbi:lysophospholipase [Massilia sp. PAMC28688]|uniref:alpha/beta hydrolase n=1 Tax=Massilia sp. PAMC28688 TaxID=2861283 RepID=UPI001C62D373|nr:alpha/beta fold hydrolase [Massilia sp. PAMC28688]QYF95997.1 lysophospholipase [Massilia sp. PAMC28688]